MTPHPDHGATVERLFHAALARPVGERAAFLADACGADESLRREVESLLAASASAEAASTGALTGRRLGAYHILGQLGAGGMGEVYRARDMRLGREIAIKILPYPFLADADRLARFDREARVLASLNHPHIAAIYGVEEAPSETGAPVRALVLELVEGETLAGLIARTGSKGLPLQNALDIARQIADALDAAHEKGIVHRDLKPANIMITPRGVVKVLDFGLAKLGSGQDGVEVADAPTIAVNHTREGVIVGTAAYMSPEQARGRSVDKRTDLWSFGCVLYEMLTGRAAFARGTVSDTLAAILEREPDWGALPRTTPASITHLLRGCLAKDVAVRLRDSGDIRTEIDAARVARTARIMTPARWGFAAVALAVALLLGGFVWYRPDRQTGPDRSDWIRLTRFADSATQPALSPDGRMLAFIRGSGTFTTSGQIYMKLLPDGEPVPLTQDNLLKMSPVFSPDGARIAYTVRETGAMNAWDTWVVPALRGEPRRWLRNASGLTWSGPAAILFSEIKSGQHMALVSSAESRAESRDVYVPAQENGMAHRSYISPDGRWVLVVEMDQGSQWLPCRLVPFDGTSTGRPVGPSNSRCTGAAWSPDQRWMYFSANAGDGFHIWRQPFPDGRSESFASGPTEEEGLAIAPDGRSLITSVGLRQRAVWIHDATGERQISLEGNAYWPVLSADGRRVCYRVAASGTTGSGHSPSELWMVDLESGENQRLLPGLTVTGFDVSRDDRIVASVVEADGKSRLWLAWLDGRAAPRRIPDVEGDSPLFGVNRDIYFRGTGGDSISLFRIAEDGTDRRRLSPNGGIDGLGAVSPDGRWVSAVGSDGGVQALMAYSTGDSAPVRIYASGSSRLEWSPDGRRAYLSLATTDASAMAYGRTYVLPLPSGSMFPAIPAGGFRAEDELMALPGVEVLPVGDLTPGASAGVYVFSRQTETRNLYRMPLP